MKIPLHIPEVQRTEFEQEFGRLAQAMSAANSGTQHGNCLYISAHAGKRNQIQPAHLCAFSSLSTYFLTYRVIPFPALSYFVTNHTLLPLVLACTDFPHGSVVRHFTSFILISSSQVAMLFLLLFIISALVALLLFDYYEHEMIYRTQTKSYVERLTEPEYRHTSIFALLGLAREEVNTFKAFRDHFTSFAEVSAAMRQTGLKQARVIIGIDFSASNEWQGRRTFRGECLHAIKGASVYNPYQKVLCILGQAFQPLVHGFTIPVFGFGDSRSRDMSVFPLKESGTPCLDFVDALEAYNSIVTKIQLGGPTNFSPLIERAVSIVRQTKAFHILLIITDGQMTTGATATRQAIVQASRCALSIIAVGVGDGPWDLLEECDDQLTARAFDNFQFVNYQEVVKSARNPETALALQALMEVPDQYRTIMRLGYLSTDNG